MDPVSLTAIGIGASAAAGGIKAFGDITGSQAQANMYKYQAAVAQINTQIAKQNASYATYAGEVEAQQSGMKTAQQIGEVKAEQGASGLDVNSGSAAKVRDSQLQVGQENEALIRSDAAKRAYGYEVEAMQATQQGTIDQYAAATSKTAGEISAIGSLLGGASSVSSKWAGAKTSGVFG